MVNIYSRNLNCILNMIPGIFQLASIYSNIKNECETYKFFQFITILSTLLVANIYETGFDKL
jgi:hypothetical protein